MILELPIQAIKTEIVETWKSGGCIISSPPGSGKTTQVPLWFLEHSTHPVYLLIPKRLAVKLAAKQLAHNFNEALGNTIGYRLRHEDKTSAKTRLIVTTYGSFLRLLISDPDKISQSTIILDEFHERSADQDFTFALLKHFHTNFDDSIKRVIMSATLNLETIADQSQLPIVLSEGFNHPVKIEHIKQASERTDHLAKFIHSVWQHKDHHVLVFLPGLREIRAIERNLPSNAPVVVLHGKLEKSPDITQLAHAMPSIILSTNIAESSVTLPNVFTVIDGGLERYVDVHPVTGISELKTRKISLASATQRTGRSCRLGAGHCIRLWSQDEESSFVAHQPIEFTYADLTDIVLATTQWGASYDELPWLEKPSLSRWQAATNKLHLWQAIDSKNQLTAHGARMYLSGLAPWQAHFLIMAADRKQLSSAIYFVAHLSHGEEINYDPSRLDCPPPINSATLKQEINRLSEKLNHKLEKKFKPLDVGLLVSAFSDRLIYVSSTGRANLTQGTEVLGDSSWKTNQWFILLDGLRSKNKIIASQTITVDESTVLKNSAVQTNLVFNIEKSNFLKTESIGKIVIKSKIIKPTPEQKVTAWSQYIASSGEQAFSWSKEAIDFKNKWRFLSTIQKDWVAWLSGNDWLTLAEPFLPTLDRLSDLNLLDALKYFLGYAQTNVLARACPTNWIAPSGRSITLTYDSENSKVSAELKLQEVFGLAIQPSIAQKTAITLLLTAPNGRPVASVTDLPFFWQTIYPEIRKELRGRYAKHPWPENPLEATATMKTNRQLRS